MAAVRSRDAARYKLTNERTSLASEPVLGKWRVLRLIVDLSLLYKDSAQHLCISAID